MKITILASPRAPHQLEHQAALSAGMRATGIESVAITAGEPATKHVACWGWRLGRALRSKGHEVLVMERGYLGDRFAWTSLAWNGLNGRGLFPHAGATPDRFNKHFSMRPWKERGDYALILGQVPGDASLQGIDLAPWYRIAADTARDAYGLPVHFRPHPNVWARGWIQNVHGCVTSAGDLSDALGGAHIAITWNSNAAVDAVLAGVPTVTADIGSMAWSVTGHQVGARITPCRDSWAHELAWRQWRIEEIASGKAVGMMMAALEGGPDAERR